MSTRKSELTRQAARLFAEKGYHGTSIGDLAEAMGVQKGSFYAHIESKADLDDATATLLALSAANWAYTWLREDADTDELADRFYAFLLDGMRGYATP